MLFVVFVVMLMGMGWLIGLYIGDMLAAMVLMLIIIIVYSFIAFLFGSAIILSMSGAKEATKPEYTYYINTVEGLALAAGIPTPKCYVIQDASPNAFATGMSPKSGAVSVTTGLLEKLNRQELEGVIAHEIAHIKNYDIRTMLVATIFVGLVTLLSDFFLRMTIYGAAGRRGGGDGRTQMVMIVVGLLLAILAPIVAYLIKLAISRKREYVADAEGARLTRYPEGLASALEKITGTASTLRNANNATAHMYISSPFAGKKGFMRNLFSTHPPADERIKRLRAM